MNKLSRGKVPGGGEAERSEVERSATERSAASPPSQNTAPPSSMSGPTAAPDPEVLEQPQRRRFSAADKLRILHEAERCPRGQLGALLRREGLYASHLRNWRKQRDAGALQGNKRGPRAATPNPLAREVAQLQKEKSRLEKKLHRAEAIIDFQKKIAAMLDIPLKHPDDEEID